ncbi:MAG: hypothetical protein QOE51_4910, partial [Actinoplanes sp.]|nr:hypothetical protein [Actinoplanes sp.]
MSDELDWETMVNQVCVAGRPGQIDGLAGQWQAVFRNAGTVSASLRDGMKDLGKTWTGPASEDYRKKILAIADAIDQFESDNKPIVDTLQSAQAALKTAQDGMPVPDYMLNEVQNRRDALDSANDAGARTMIGEAGAIPTLGLSFVGAYFLPDSFVKPLADSFVGKWGRELFGHFTAMWDDFNGKMTAEARTYYDNVDGSFQQADLVLPGPSSAREIADVNSTPPSYSTGGPGSGVSAPPTSGTGSGFDPASANPSLHAGAVPGIGDGTGDGSPGFGDPGAAAPSAGDLGTGGGGSGGGFKDPSTGLAGAGGPTTGAGGLGGMSG